MGVYPINMMRNFFGEKPIEVSACGVRDPDLPLNFDDTVSVMLRFAGHHVAQFAISYNDASIDQYHILDTKGDLEISPGFMFSVGLKYQTIIDGKTHEQTFDAADQFDGELQHFSSYILNNREPRPNDKENLAGVRVLAVIERALEPGQPQNLEPFQHQGRMGTGQMYELSPVPSSEFMDAVEPNKE